MRTIKLMVLCLVILSIQMCTIGEIDMPFSSSQKTSLDTFTQETSIITLSDYGTAGDGIIDDAAAIQAAIGDCKPQGGSVLFPKGTYRIGSSITLDENVVFFKGSKLSIDSGVTVTISGVLDAGAYQIFEGDGNISLAPGSCEHVLAQWWGAIGDGSTDCTSAFDSAMIAAQTVGKFIIPSGTYIISSPLRNWPVGIYAYKDAGITIQGVGTETVILYTGTTGYCFEITNPDPTANTYPDGNTIQDLHIQAGNVTDPELGGCILCACGCDTSVNRVTVKNADNATFLHARMRETQALEDGMATDSNLDFTTTGTGGTEKIAIKFNTPSRASHLKTVTVRLGITGSPAGTVHAELWSDSSGPSAQIGKNSNEITINTISSNTDGEDVTFEWEEYGDYPSTSNITDYWIVLSTTGYTYTDGVTELRLRYDDDGGSSEVATFTWGGTWSIDADNGANYDIRCRYGQAIMTAIHQCYMQGVGGVGRGIWLEDQAFVNITDSYIRGAQIVRNEFGYFRSSNTYYLGSGSSNLIYDTGWSVYIGGTIEAGGSNASLYFGGINRVHTLIGVALSVVGIDKEVGTWVHQIAGGKDLSQANAADLLPDAWLYRVIGIGEDALGWNIGSASVATDSDALEGYAVQISTGANTDYRCRYRWHPGSGHYSILPRGRYRFTFWAKDTNQEEDDVQVTVDRWTGSSWTTSGRMCYFTATADYQPYTVWLDQLAADVSSMARGHRITIYKRTASTNTISVSHAIMEYVGPDLLTTKPVALISSDRSDDDGSRKSGVEFWGYKSGNEFGALATVEASHDGSGDDYKGELNIKINTGTTAYSGYSDLKTIQKYSASWDVFTDGDATPSVSSGNQFKTANTGATTITTFDGSVSGKEIFVVINDGNTTIDFTGTNLKGNGGADWLPSSGDHMRCRYDGANWYCEVSDNTP